MNTKYPENHKKIDKNKVGILLINLGTPDKCNFLSVRKYLKEFLSDRRVIEGNPFIWQIILNFIILNVRPQKTAKNYKKIWMNDIDESPLLFYSRNQAKKLQERFPEYVIDFAMRYGSNNIPSKINDLLSNGCRKILFIPLYPQYSACTTASVSDAIFKTMLSLRWQPEIKMIHSYHDNSHYINAIYQSCKEYLENNNNTDCILFSFHGIPQQYFDKGDPYSCYCYKSFRLISEKIKENFNVETDICFQSRFGPTQWLQPYAEDKMLELIRNNNKNIAMISPGFSVDCIETLEEINMGYKEFFLENGGIDFSYIPCLNDSNISINMISALIQDNVNNI